MSMNSDQWAFFIFPSFCSTYCPIHAQIVMFIFSEIQILNQAKSLLNHEHPFTLSPSHMSESIHKSKLANSHIVKGP